MPNYTWYPLSCTPTFKLSYGTSESGARITKSVSIRNIAETVLTNATHKTAFNNIIHAFISTNAFEYPIYQIIANAKYFIEEDY